MPVLRAMSEVPRQPLVAFMARGAVGAHVGLAYLADDEGSRRYLHLAWHFDLREDDESLPDAMWLESSLDELALGNVGASARLIARRRREGRVPYAFDAADADYTADGRLRLNSSLGLTCASFVLLVFRHAFVDLVDSATWQCDRSAQRIEEDEAAQQKLVDFLAHHGDPDAAAHAERVREQVGVTRVRAEEVAAATALAPPPATFLDAEPVGRDLLEQIYELDVNQRAFHVDTGDAKVRGRFTPEHEDALLDALSDHERVRVHLVGTGRFDAQGLQDIDVLDEVTPIAEGEVSPPELRARAEELVQLEHGWLDGEAGLPPDHDGMMKVIDVLVRMYDEGELPLPHLYATPEGNIEAEWTFGSWELSASVDLKTGDTEFDAVEVETGAGKDAHASLYTPEGRSACIDFIGLFANKGTS